MTIVIIENLRKTYLLPIKILIDKCGSFTIATNSTKNSINNVLNPHR